MTLVPTTGPKARPETLEHDACYEVVLSRDTSFDGVFIVAVRTTGIYCRPSCSSRTPLSKNVTFFASNEAAEEAGFRACKRCKPQQYDYIDDRPGLVARASERLELEDETIPLPELAKMLETTPGALNSSFRRVLGMTVQQYVEARRVERLKDGLRDGQTVTRAMYDAGYGSSSRLYEGAVGRLGMSPGEYKRGGRGMTIAYAITDSPMGRVLVAGTARGVCSVRFGDDDQALAESVHAEFPRADVSQDEGRMHGWLDQLREHLQGLRPRLDIPIDVQGTAFQWRVWRALQKIGYGQTKSYKQVAEEIGQPAAVRAVARACATNHVAVIIPCHRVIGSDGSLTGYAYGVQRKAALLETEAAAAAAEESRAS